MCPSVLECGTAHLESDMILYFIMRLPYPAIGPQIQSAERAFFYLQWRILLFLTLKPIWNTIHNSFYYHNVMYFWGKHFIQQEREKEQGRTWFFYTRNWLDCEETYTHTTVQKFRISDFLFVCSRNEHIRLRKM